MVASEPTTEDRVTAPVDGVPSPSATNRPTLEVIGLSILLTIAACLVAAGIPDLGEALRPSGSLAAPLLALGFGTTLLTYFRIEFRGNAILFSLSEIPLIFALVYLDPITGLTCRLVASLAIFALVKRSPVHKVLFNLALFGLETSVAYLIA